MVILGMDTSTHAASVACMKDGEIIGEMTINNKRTHSEKLMPMIDQVLEMAQITPDMIDCVAVGHGPGSFTGLRIGVTTAKALAHGWGCPVVEVSSLEVLAKKVGGYKHVCSMMDARRDTVFTGIYGQKGMEACQMHIDDLLNHCKIYDEIAFIGDGAYKHADKISSILGEKAFIQARYMNHLSASQVCQLALDQMNEKAYDQVGVLYLNKTEAERNYEESR